MFGVEFGHQADACTFEVLAARFAVDDPAAAWIGRIVHDLDLREARYGEPEAAGVGTVVEGLRRAHPEDRELLERGIAFIESLAQGFQARTRPPAARWHGPGTTPRTIDDKRQVPLCGGHPWPRIDVSSWPQPASRRSPAHARRPRRPLRGARGGAPPGAGEFPALGQQVNGRPLAYLDSAATTLRPRR